MSSKQYVANSNYCAQACHLGTELRVLLRGQHDLGVVWANGDVLGRRERLVGLTMLQSVLQTVLAHLRTRKRRMLTGWMLNGWLLIGLLLTGPLLNGRLLMGLLLNGQLLMGLLLKKRLSHPRAADDLSHLPGQTKS